MLDESATVKDQMLLGRGAKQLWPQWMPDGKSFYFVSDRVGGQQNVHLYTMGKGRAGGDLIHQRAGAVSELEL